LKGPRQVWCRDGSGQAPPLEVGFDFFLTPLVVGPLFLGAALSLHMILSSCGTRAFELFTKPGFLNPRFFDLIPIASPQFIPRGKCTWPLQKSLSLARCSVSPPHPLPNFGLFSGSNLHSSPSGGCPPLWSIFRTLSFSNLPRHMVPA